MSELYLAVSTPCEVTSIFGEVDDEFFESKVGIKLSMFNFDK
jgi:hypothetical protein